MSPFIPTTVTTPAGTKLEQRIATSPSAGIANGYADVGTPEWWRNRLMDFMMQRRPRISVYEDYYAGRHRLSFATDKYREAFGNLFGAFSDNWCDLVVDASVERLGVEGFRFGGAKSKNPFDSPAADDEAWEIWQENSLDSESDLAHTDAVKNGVCYILVTPNPDGGVPLVQVEHPYNAIVEVDPSRPTIRLAGLRMWCDAPNAVETCVLYLPDEVYWWRRPVSQGSSNAGGWERYEENNGRNALGVVPLIPLLNNPQLYNREGRSDLGRVIPIQDAINKLATDMLIASEYAAYRQRWVTGIEIPPAGADGKLPTQFLNAMSRAWATQSKDAHFGEFQASDLSNYVTAMEALVQHLAAQTRTPPHYLLGSSGNFPSGESLKATETGLVAKCRRKHQWFGESWEEAIRLAFKIKGNAKAKVQDAETIWRDPESRSEGERVDALTKMDTLGVPKPALWKAWGATPQQIEEWSRYAKAAEEEQKAQEQQQLEAQKAAAQSQPPGTPARPQAGGPKPPPPAGGPGASKPA